MSQVSVKILQQDYVLSCPDGQEAALLEAVEYKMQDFLEDYTDSKYYLKEKGVKFVTSSKNRNKRYTQINGEIALSQKANQQFNWHGDFVFEQSESEFDEFIFDVNDVEEKYYLSDKVRDYVLSSGTKTFKTSIKTDLDVGIQSREHLCHTALLTFKIYFS